RLHGRRGNHRRRDLTVVVPNKQPTRTYGGAARRTADDLEAAAVDDGAGRGTQDLLDKPFSVRGAPCGRPVISSLPTAVADGLLQWRGRRCASCMPLARGEKEESRWRGEVPAARLSSSRVDWLAQPIC